MNQNKTMKKEIKALRSPFLRELFRENRFNLAMTLVSAALMAAGQLVISWLIKEIVDLISGLSRYTIGTLLAIAGGGLALMEGGSLRKWDESDGLPSGYIQAIYEKRLRSRFIYFIERYTTHRDLCLVPSAYLHRAELKRVHMISYSTHLLITE